MRSAQSRLGLVSSLGSTGRGVRRCVDAVPVSARAIKMGATAFAGLSGFVLLRGLLPSRRRPVAALPSPSPAPAAARCRKMGRFLFTETLAILVLPLCRYYLLGEKNPVSNRLSPIIDRFFRKVR